MQKIKELSIVKSLIKQRFDVRNRTVLIARVLQQGFEKTIT